MIERKNGGPAFPVGSDIAPSDEGITLRDYFVGQMIAPFATHYAARLPEEARTLAKRAYEIADAMLAERDR